VHYPPKLPTLPIWNERGKVTEYSILIDYNNTIMLKFDEDDTVGIHLTYIEI
jgi:hypothetical protein